ncbi:MAG: hypothetical protein ACRCY3_07895 [Sphingorhabdus sp.]
MLRNRRLAAAIAITVVTTAALIAQDEKDVALDRPKLFDDVVACKAIADPDNRLACYDEKVSALDEAAKKQDIILTDRAAVKEAKRGLFGFDIPKIRIFGGGEDVNEIEVPVKSVSANRAGILSITLDDGARWQQVDTKILNNEPRPGAIARIRKASMGSYLVNFNGGPAIRMKRVN